MYTLSSSHYHFSFGTETKSSVEQGYGGNQELQRKENIEKPRLKINKFKRKLKYFYMSILQKKVGEINSLNCISLYL